MKIKSYINDIAMKLAEDGYGLIVKAYLEANYNKGKTQNLHDSYGSAVYFNKALYPNTKRFFSELATTSKYDPYEDRNITGRRAIEEFFNSYVPDNDGLQLVVVVAMFYGGILERNLRKKYKVIFMIGDDVKKLASKIKGATVSKIERDKVSTL